MLQFVSVIFNQSNNANIKLQVFVILFNIVIWYNYSDDERIANEENAEMTIASALTTIIYNISLNNIIINSKKMQLTAVT